MIKTDRISRDIEAGLVVLTEGQHSWVFSGPNEEGLREVYFDGEEEGKGILLGVTVPSGRMRLGHMNQSADVEMGRRMGVKFPDRPESKRIAISAPVTVIIAMSNS